MPGRRRRATRRPRATSTTRTTAAATRRRAPAKPSRAAKPAAELPVAGPGERVWVLAVPFRAPAPGAVWHAGLQAHVWVGAELPPELAPYDPPPYTLERFLEDELNEKPRPLPIARPMTPRDQQWRGRRRRRRARGGRRPGVPARRRPRRGQDRHRDPRRPADRRAARRAHRARRRRPAGGDHHPALGALDRRVRRRRAALVRHHLGPAGEGRRSSRFDVVIADEAHMVRHTTTQRWKHWKAVSGAAPGQGRAVRPRRDRHPGAHPAGAALPGAAVRRRGTASRCASGPTCRSGWPRTGSTWNVAATAGHGPRTPTSAAPTWPGCSRWLADADPPATLHRPAPWGPVSVTGTAGRADAGRARRLRLGVVGVPRRDAAGPAVPAEREGPGRAAAVPAEGRADPRAGDRRLGEGAGRGRAAGRGVGGVRRDGGRPDPRGAARRRHPGGRHLRPRPVRRRGRAAALPARRGDGLRLHRDGVDQPARRRAAARRDDGVASCRGSACSTSRGSPASRPGRSPAARTATGAARRGGSPSPRTPSRSRSPG